MNGQVSVPPPVERTLWEVLIGGSVVSLFIVLFVWGPWIWPVLGARIVFSAVRRWTGRTARGLDRYDAAIIAAGLVLCEVVGLAIFVIGRFRPWGGGLVEINLTFCSTVAMFSFCVLIIACRSMGWLCTRGSLWAAIVITGLVAPLWIAILVGCFGWEVVVAELGEI